MMRTRRLLAALVAAVALSATASAEPMRSWVSGGKNNTYTSGPITLSFGVGHDSDGASVPGFQLKSPGFAPYAVIGQAGPNPVRANYAVLKLDPKNPLPQVLFTSSSGGDHCCTRVYVVAKVQTGWTAFDLGLWDGEPLKDIPTDIDGDKIIDIVLSDDRFLNAFASYEESFAPPIIIDVYAGSVRDVSRDPRFKKIYAARMAKLKDQCTAQMNGACAAYVANGARAGQFDAAWKFMLAHYDKDAKWTYATRCKGKQANGSCAGQQIKPKDFPEALRWFLEDRGYIARKG
jgi:hypothetical protein